MLLQFFMPMVPPTITAQEQRIAVRGGKPVVYKQAELKEAKQKLLAHLAAHKPAVPFHGAVCLTVVWNYPITGKHYDGEYKTTKPDTDNAIKMLKDCMTKLGFWKDDAQVASEHSEKFWSEIPGIFIAVEDIGG